MGVLDKILGTLGLAEKPEENAEPMKRGLSREEKSVPAKKRSTEIEPPSLPAQPASPKAAVTPASDAAMRIIVIEPSIFDDVQLVADYLKKERPVVINFERTEQDIAKRIIDFISGVTYALGGTIQKVGNHIFFAAPSNIDVGDSLPDTLLNGQFIPWQQDVTEREKS